LDSDLGDSLTHPVAAIPGQISAAGAYAKRIEKLGRQTTWFASQFRFSASTRVASPVSRGLSLAASPSRKTE
jgi:hypothetical protein